MEANSLSLQTLLDKQEIHEQLVRYCRAVDRRDLSLLQAVFHVDAVADYGELMMEGAAIAPQILQAASGMRETQHLIGNILIDTVGASADSEAYFVVSATVDLRGVAFTRTRAGRYVDRFERRDGGWKIARRIVVDDWSRLDPIGERPAGTASRVGRPAPHDAVYEHRLR